MPVKIEDEYYVLDDEKRKLVEENYAFIHYMSRRWDKKLNGLIEYDDLVGIATIAFIKSLKYFDSTRSKITSYTSNLIDQYIRREAGRVLNKIVGFETLIDQDIVNIIEDKSYLYYKRNTNRIENSIINNIIIDNMYHKYKNNFNSNGKNALYLYIYKDWAQAEIARYLNISRERVRQIIVKFHNYCKEDKEIKDLIAS